MKKKRITNILFALTVFLLVLAVVLGFVFSVREAGEKYASSELENLERALRRAAAACYAAEGAYPPDISYLCEHYGVKINEDRYKVFYEAVAENLMPDITVVEWSK